MFVLLFTGILGLGMIVYWSLMLIQRKIPETNTEPIRITFHILAELITGILLLAAALMIYFDAPVARPLFLFAMGMLTYTLIASPGYFAQKRQWPWVLVFCVILILSIYCLFAYVV